MTKYAVNIFLLSPTAHKAASCGGTGLGARSGRRRVGVRRMWPADRPHGSCLLFAGDGAASVRLAARTGAQVSAFGGLQRPLRARRAGGIAAA